MTYSEEIAKRDAEFYKAFAKNKNINRADFNKKHPIKIVQEVKGFGKVPRNFDVTAAPSPEHKKIYSALTTYCEKFPNAKTPNILLWGATGTGKTYAANIIANNLLDRGFGVEYITAFGLVNAFQKYIQDFGRDSTEIDALINCDLLIIDDLGAEPTIKNITQEHIYNIINERLVNNRPFIITTNLSPVALIDRYDQRIASRITAGDTSARIEFKGKDLRLS